MCFILCSFYDTMYRPTKLVHRCQCCQQGVSFPDAEGPADLLGDHDPPEVVHSSDNASCFHISFSFSVGTPLLRCPRTPEDGCPYNYFTNYDAIICKQGRFILVQRKKKPHSSSMPKALMQRLKPVLWKLPSNYTQYWKMCQDGHVAVCYARVFQICMGSFS